jgi:hypothetical protein
MASGIAMNWTASQPATQVICFTHQQAWCPGCERNVIQAASGELLGCAIGFHPPSAGRADQQPSRTIAATQCHLTQADFRQSLPGGGTHHSVLSSLLITAQRQGRDGRSALLALFTQPLPVAKKAFYYNSS